MLHKILADKLEPEVRLLHELKIKVSAKSFQQRLSSAVRQARARVTVNTKDMLAEKLSKYGNHGGWYKGKKTELDRVRKHREAFKPQFIPVDLEADSFPPPEKHGKNCCCIYC